MWNMNKLRVTLLIYSNDSIIDFSCETIKKYSALLKHILVYQTIK